MRRLLYSVGPFGSSLLQQTVLLWVFYFYAPPPSESLAARTTPALLGLAMGLGRVVDAVVDPLVGHLSDRSRRPGGRRRPFVIVGAIVMALSFALLWRPPHPAPTTLNFLYVTAILGAFFLFFTVALNPYMALLSEITTSSHDRLATAAWQTVFTLVGTAIAFVLSGHLITRVGFPAMGVWLAPLGALPLVIAAAVVREPPAGRAHVGFLTALRVVFGNGAFRIFIVGFALLWLGLSIVNLGMAFYVTELMRLPRQAVGSVLGVSVVAMVLATPLITRLAHRTGQVRVLLGAMMFAGALLPLLATIGLWPVALGPAAQGYMLVAAASPALATLFTLPNSILADLAHTVGRDGGQRLEGMFFAFQGLILNGATSIASLILGLTLSWGGYGLGLRVAPLIAAGFVIAGVLVFRRFPGIAGSPTDRPVQA
jgi:GPH family glycoside/pentoside/hexuronide:cation symporter